MNEVKEIFNRLFEWVKKWKWWKFHIVIILVMMAIVVLGTWDAYHHQYLIGEDKPITLEYLVGFLVTITTIYIFVWRVKNLEKQIKIQTQQIDIQIKKEVDDRFTTAVNLLGSSETSARTGAIYSLYQQAVEHKKYRQQIVQILCSHIRSKTQEPNYQQQYKDRPSNEIQTAIDLLFRERENKGLYSQFRQDISNANLSYAYCVGANFGGAFCQGADFREANCQRANFEGAGCQRANFEGTHCQRINFEGANCQGTNFEGTYCQGANFRKAHCEDANFYQTHGEGANFEVAHCQGASFWGAHCQGADFRRARCEGANFGIAYCEGADFGGAFCQGAYFGVTFCQGADFRDAHCQGAYESNPPTLLEYRIGEDTELKELTLEGALSEWSIDAIEKAEPYCSSYWYSKMQKIIEVNKDKEIKYGTPDGIKSEILEDSDELTKTIKLLKEIKERNVV